jgi:peroxiredoxin
MTKKALFFLVFVLLLAACAPLIVEAKEFAPSQGAKAPHFDLLNMDGEAVSLADYQGSVVMLNFWATWCAPCRFEMPALQDRYENTELEILAINFDESEELVRSFAEELQLTFPILMDPGGLIQDLYKVRGYPSSYFIDEQGIIRIVQIGLMDEDQLDGYLEDLGIQF